jgi:hypothetical protein
MPNVPQGIQYEADGRPFLFMPNGSKNYISPAAFNPNARGPDSASYLHTGSQWNQETGQWENPVNWSNLLSTGIGGMIAAPFVVPALAGIGGGTTATSGFVGPTLAQAGGTAAGVSAGTAAGTAAGVLPATTIGAGYAPALGGTSSLAAGGGGSLLSTLASNRLVGQGASLALGAIGGGIPDQASNTSTTTRPLDPAFSPLQNQLIQMIMGRLQSGDSLPAGYEGTGIKNINSTFDAADLSRNADLTRRGLASSPIAGASDAGFQSRRAGTIADFRSNLPLVSRDLQTQDLGLAANLLNFGRNSTTTTGTQQQGGGTAGTLENLAGILAMYYGSR